MKRDAIRLPVENAQQAVRLEIANEFMDEVEIHFVFSFSPRRRFGGGGMFFFEKIINFWFYEIKKILLGIWDKTNSLGQLSATHRLFSATNRILKFQKFAKFCHF